METLIYNVSQQELYKISRLGWRNFNHHISGFSRFTNIYTKEYGISCMTEIDVAEALPTENIYYSISEENRILLTRAVDSCLIKWQNLKRYITKAYDADSNTTMLNAAGQLHYTGASNYNWQSVNMLIDDASAFIKDQKANLVASENMPPNFGDNFIGAKDIFTALQAKIFGPGGDSTQYKQNKIKANNAIFTKLIKMLEDGQQIFINEENIRRLFIFDNLKAFSSMNQSGIRGFVTDVQTGLPIEAATISPANHAFVTITDNTGHYNLKLAIGNYLVTISANGYVCQNKMVTVNKDMISQLNIKLSGIAASN